MRSLPCLMALCFIFASGCDRKFADEHDDDGGDDTSASESTTDADTDGDADVDTDTDIDTDTDTGADEEMIGLHALAASCDTSTWYYSVTTDDSVASVALIIADFDIGALEDHTLQQNAGSEFGRELFLVSDYYYQDVATQFDCVDGGNPSLTWRVDLYGDPSFTSYTGCVTWGWDPSAFHETHGCEIWGG